MCNSIAFSDALCFASFLLGLVDGDSLHKTTNGTLFLPPQKNGKKWSGHVRLASMLANPQAGPTTRESKYKIPVNLLVMRLYLLLY